MGFYPRSLLVLKHKLLHLGFFPNIQNNAFSLLIQYLILHEMFLHYSVYLLVFKITVNFVR